MSIYEFLKEKDPKEFAAGGYQLPDSGDLHLRAGEVWVPGAFEGILLRTDSRIKQHVLINYHIANVVKKQALYPSEAHDEFTLYVVGTAVRLLNTTARNSYLLDLAENVHGWGKISILYELDYTDPEVCLWAVKYGCENTVGLSYLSNVCATKGKMAVVLSEMLEDRFSPEEEQALFRGICDIFTGLLNPEEKNDGLSNYADARIAAKHFNALCERKPDLATSDVRTENIRSGLRFIL